MPPAEGEKPRRIAVSEKFACPVSGFTISEIEPRLFSFNNPAGACPAATASACKLAFDADLIVPDKDKTLHKGAVAPWAKGPSPLYTQTLQALARHYGFSMDTPWQELPEQAQTVVLSRHRNREDQLRLRRQRPQIRGRQALRRRAAEPRAALARDRLRWVREELGRYQSDTPCPTCAMGKRLKPEALAVKSRDADIAEVSAMSIRRPAIGSRRSTAS
jgi:excinuclease ABC subunit A